jgi:hypothetical protein
MKKIPGIFRNMRSYYDLGRFEGIIPGITRITIDFNHPVATFGWAE